MKKVFSIQYPKSNVRIFYFLILFVVSLFGCKRVPKFEIDRDYYPQGKGFTLQKFEVINPQLDSLIQDAQHKVQIYNKTWDLEFVVILDLILDDSREIVFNFSFVRLNNISEHHIFNHNQRIVGYIDIKNDTIITLSNVQSKYDFYFTFKKFVKPTSETQYFDYIYFPDNLYEVSVDGMMGPPPLLYDDFYSFGYIYRNNEFIYTDENE